MSTRTKVGVRASVAALVALLCILPGAVSVPVSAQASFAVDVWTGKGGQGAGAGGGNFAPGEEIVVYIWGSHDCYASITIAPYGEEPTQYIDAQLNGGDTVRLNAPTDLTGSWEVTVSAATMSGSAVASDYVVFSVGSVAPPAPTPPPTTSTPQTAAVTEADATALDALIALKMAEGSLPVELAYDVNADGQVTADDARQILRWAVQ